MTATPIPRTLVLTFFGDMDVSKLDEKPAQAADQDQRAADGTARSTDRADSGAFCAGDKIYWFVRWSRTMTICRHIAEAVSSPAELLGQNVGLVHGRMKPAEKDAAMLDFKEGRTRVLVATTVIEVGVDVPTQRSW